MDARRREDILLRARSDNGNRDERETLLWLSRTRREMLVMLVGILVIIIMRWVAEKPFNDMTALVDLCLAADCAFEYWDGRKIWRLICAVAFTVYAAVEFVTYAGTL